MKLVDTLYAEIDGEATVFFAGRHVPVGSYLNVETGRTIELDKDDDVLPASLDGHVAAYIPSPLVWSDIKRMRASKSDH